MLIYSTLPTGLEKAYPCTYRHVQTFHASEHGNGNKLIARLACQPPHALPLCAQHPGNGAVDRGRIKAVFCIGSRPDYCDPTFLEPAQGARKICHGDVWDSIGCPARNLVNSCRKPNRTILGCDDRVDAKCVRHTQAGAEIVWIGDAIKDQQQRWFAKRIKDVVDSHMAARGIDGGGDAMMTYIARHSRKPFMITQDHAHTLSFGQGGQVAYTLVVTFA